MLSALMTGIALSGSDDDDLKTLISDMTGLMAIAKSAVDKEKERLDSERPEDEYRIVGRWRWECSRPWRRTSGG
jgi:hypothetical protein